MSYSWCFFTSGIPKWLLQGLSTVIDIQHKRFVEELRESKWQEWLRIYLKFTLIWTSALTLLRVFMIHDDHQQLFRAPGEADDKFMVKFWTSIIFFHCTYQQFTKIFGISDGMYQLEPTWTNLNLNEKRTDELSSNSGISWATVQCWFVVLFLSNSHSSNPGENPKGLCRVGFIRTMRTSTRPRLDPPCAWPPVNYKLASFSIDVLRTTARAGVSMPPQLRNRMSLWLRL